ncbi:MAG: EcoRI family type II restriction endonuclease [Candidatus Cloacimonadaceae bacterium]|nr:EcoRI family type II restriction endonuclease [Candidatus Cloacimonadaceae bacterium]MDP3114491.1 EcoRI family type II restriction endonuclease [Candidatus Cloacimonadaceae bacterium]
MKPDGGIVFIKDNDDKSYPILISEAKNQGTNDLRAEEGLKKQAHGNAVERLGKNVIGFKTAVMFESIFPFVCFGYGCDFADGCSIIDRVVTIAMFSELNVVRLHNEGASQQVNRGSFFFRKEKWSETEMYNIMFDIADRSILYYFSKYKQENFVTQ